MAHSSAFLVLSLMWFDVICSSHQLPTSQLQVLLQLRKRLEYPKLLEAWDYNQDICNTPPSPSLRIVCAENSVTELHIVGDKTVKASTFDGSAIPYQTLSQDFSIDSFVTTLARLTNLKVVCLVALGLWGPLPEKIHRLYSLEVLDLSSNFLYGPIPPKLAAMVKLHSLTLDSNFFNGTLPDWFDSFSNLTVLSLKSNQLGGQFPPSIGRMKNLTVVSLSHNHITGGLPDLSGLASLKVLDLRENRLEFGLPFIPKGLVTILLSNNSFSSEIPQQFSKLTQLQRLDLSHNFLHGMPPTALFSLPNINYLNLASNLLSGSLPRSLKCGVELAFVDISMNRFTDRLPLCLSSTSEKILVKKDGNCLAIDPQHQHKESYCKEIGVKRASSSGKRIGVLAGVIGGSALVMLLFGLTALTFYRWYCRQGVSETHQLPKPVLENSSMGLSSELLANARFISQAMKLGMQGSPTYRTFSIEELKEATKNFHQSTFLGSGSIGQLYKGKLENGSYVAIRCLAFSSRHSVQNLKLQLDLLSKLHHPHLVHLLGHCVDGVVRDDSATDRIFLIYEYISNGNLRSHLFEHDPEIVLKWPERLAVLIGAAKAVHFLHTGVIPGFFNNHLKTNSILLDEHRIPKLSDYGLSIITDEIYKNELKANEREEAYSRSSPFDLFAPKQAPKHELLPTAFTAIYSLIGPASSFSSQDGQKRMVDPIVLATSCQESLSIILSLTNKCMSLDPSIRPSMEDVLWNLQYAAQVQATADGDQRSDATSQTDSVRVDDQS
ncbi:hypothetical protein ACLOJK_009095 [Asimina triloba]